MIDKFTFTFWNNLAQTDFSAKIKNFRMPITYCLILIYFTTCKAEKATFLIITVTFMFCFDY